mmetsp:Transcript_7564/g.19579  ORF Transcript_7564/g.19579 Transcript_7564/m.19579 type:complete len:200 (-) Transcript_7564:228-827(-)
MWTLRDRLYMVSGGKVYHQPIGGGAQSGPESWDIIDDTVQAAYVADERLYVIKGGKVFHAAASQAATAGVEIVGPEAWPLVDGEVQAALVTTDAKLGIARYVTVRRSRGPTPPPDDSVTLPLPTCLPAVTTHFLEKHHHGFRSPPAMKGILYVYMETPRWRAQSSRPDAGYCALLREPAIPIKRCENLLLTNKNTSACR